uniref:DUF6284 family protein n=1 Tax=Micromonospora carbonacea TaxID=47853 RepID=UPI003B218964
MDIVAWDEREPSAVELAAIEAEWPLIEADLSVLDAEIAEVLGESLGWAPERVHRLDRLVEVLDEQVQRVTPIDLDWRGRRRRVGRLLADVRRVFEVPGQVAA